MSTAPHQDWSVHIVNKKEKKGPLKSDKDILAARRQGDAVETIKKVTGGINKSSKQIILNAAKLEEDTGDYHVDTVSHSFAQALQKARLAKKMTQQQLAQSINEKHSVVNDYEAGRAVPNGQIINKLNKVLGTRLPPAKEKTKKIID